MISAKTRNNRTARTFMGRSVVLTMSTFGCECKRKIHVSLFVLCFIWKPLMFCDRRRRVFSSFSEWYSLVFVSSVGRWFLRVCFLVVFRDLRKYFVLFSFNLGLIVRGLFVAPCSVVVGGLNYWRSYPVWCGVPM